MQIQIEIKNKYKHHSKQMKKKNIVKGTKDPDIKWQSDKWRLWNWLWIAKQKIPSEMEVVNPVTRVSNGLCAVQIWY